MLPRFPILRQSSEATLSELCNANEEFPGRFIEFDNTRRPHSAPGPKT